MNRPNDIAKAASAGRVFDFTGATVRLDLMRDHFLRCGVTFGLNLGSDARDRVVEAITDGTLVISFLEIYGNPQVALLDLNFLSIIDDRAVTVAAKLVFPSAQLGGVCLGLCHRAHSGERYRLAFLTAAGAEDGIFLMSFNDRTAVG